MALILGTLLVAFAVGVVIRRWPTLLLVLVIPTYYVGLHLGWWGHGVGDFWEVAATIWIAAALLGVTIGVAVGRVLDQDRGSAMRRGGG